MLYFAWYSPKVAFRICFNFNFVVFQTDLNKLAYFDIWLEFQYKLLFGNSSMLAIQTLFFHLWNFMLFEMQHITPDC